MISLVHLPTFIVLLLIGLAAMRDGRDGIYGRTFNVLRLVSKRPAFSPLTNAAHAQRQADLAIDSRATAWREAIETLSIELTTLRRAWTIVVEIVFLLVVEVAGHLQLLTAAGVSEGKRLLLAPALAIAFFCFTEYVFTLAQKKSKYLFWIVILATLIVFFLAAIQFDSVSADDGESSPAATVGLALLLSLAIVAPSARAAYVLREAGKVWPKLRKRAELRQWLRAAEARVNAAKRYIANRAAWTEWWDERVVRLENQYDYKFCRAFMRQHNDPKRLQELIGSETSLVPENTATPQVAATPKSPKPRKKDEATIHPFARDLATPTPLLNPYKGKKS